MAKKTDRKIGMALKKLNQSVASSSEIITALVEGLKETNNNVEIHDKILAHQGKKIVELENAVREMRNNAIRAESETGVSGRNLSAKYGLSKGRISQIKNDSCK